MDAGLQHRDWNENAALPPFTPPSVRCVSSPHFVFTPHRKREDRCSGKVVLKGLFPSGSTLSELCPWVLCVDTNGCRESPALLSAIAILPSNPLKFDLLLINSQTEREIHLAFRSLSLLFFSRCLKKPTFLIFSFWKVRAFVIWQIMHFPSQALGPCAHLVRGPASSVPIPLKAPNLFSWHSGWLSFPWAAVWVWCPLAHSGGEK